MGWVSGLAIFFIIWWTALFAVLPIGVRTQHDENDTILGTERGAPASLSLGRKFLWTTLVSVLVFAAFYLVTEVWGIGVDSFPHFF